MNKPDEEFELKFRERPSASIVIDMPVETLNALKGVAASRDMSDTALLKLYIGQGLRQDLTRQFAERVLETTAQVLARHIASQEEVAAIIDEIRTEASS
jgi:hypothetical protein